MFENKVFRSFCPALLYRGGSEEAQQELSELCAHKGTVGPEHSSVHLRIPSLLPSLLFHVGSWPGHTDAHPESLEFISDAGRVHLLLSHRA